MSNYESIIHLLVRDKMYLREPINYNKYRDRDNTYIEREITHICLTCVFRFLFFHNNCCTQHRGDLKNLIKSLERTDFWHPIL